VCSGASVRFDEQGREALLKYILRPAVAQERVTRGPDGLVRIALKKPFADGTVAVDLDPLSLLSRLAASVPSPRLHTVRYAGVLASASKLRGRLAPKRAAPTAACVEDTAAVPRRSPYRPWAELLKRTFGFDVLACPRCDGRLRLLAMVTATQRALALPPRSRRTLRHPRPVSRPRTSLLEESRSPTSRRRPSRRVGRARRRVERPRPSGPSIRAGAQPSCPLSGPSKDPASDLPQTAIGPPAPPQSRLIRLRCAKHSFDQEDAM
jgi:hypothetical protein